MFNGLRVRENEAEMRGECSIFGVTLALESCMICDVLSCRKRLFFARSTRGAVASNRFVHHVVVRHGNMTSVCDVVLVNFFCTLRYSNPLRLGGCVLVIFLRT